MDQRIGAHALIVPVAMIMTVIVVMPVTVMMMVMVMIVRRLLAEPAPHIGGFGGGIVEAAIKQCSCALHSRCQAISSWSSSDPMMTLNPMLTIGDQIGLAQYDAVGDGDLLDGLDMAIERGIAIDRIDQRDDAVEPESLDK